MTAAHGNAEHLSFVQSANLPPPAVPTSFANLTWVTHQGDGLRNRQPPLGTRLRGEATQPTASRGPWTSLAPAVATMDAFLTDAPDKNHACATIEDLTLQLARLRDTKATDTKAEHISETFEFRSTVVFNVPEHESESADPGQNPDQAVGGTPGGVPTAHMNGNASATTTREIRAIDTLLNQPTDDPALQKLVAKHIIASLGSVDGSSWTVRSVSRNASGWTFTYLCKNSTQAWMRQNSKNSAKLRIAESSGKDGQDPINLCKRKLQNLGGRTWRLLANSEYSTACV